MMKHASSYEAWRVDTEYWADMTKVRGTDKTFKLFGAILNDIPWKED